MLALTMIVGSGITVSAEEIDVPQEVVEISEELGAQYNICPELIQAICYKESRFRPDVESGGCVGIMQISPKWHKDRMDRLGVTDLKDIGENMKVATDYLSELSESYEDVGVVLMIYNGDSSVQDVICGADRVLEYAEEILAISEELERKNGK